MCGIFGYIGPEDGAAEKILEGLKALEYRGYDSWGIAVVSDDKIVIDRKVGKIGNATVDLPDSTIGIGHTRWATHGGVTEANAHPHLDETGRIAVVHNGIIENYHELKAELADKGYSFASETDSEVIAFLIAEELKEKDAHPENLKDAACSVFKELVGSNAMCVLDKKIGAIAVCRNGSPVIVGMNEETVFVGSDVTPFLKYTNRVVFLDDGECALLTEGGEKSGISVYDIESQKKKALNVEEINWKAEDAKKDGHPHYLIKEITEQLKTIPQTASLNQKEIEKVAKLLKNDHKLLITGCGTAAFCAFAGEKYFVANDVNARAIGAYEFEPYAKFIDDKTVFIAISQSGETADTLIAVKEAKKRGAHIVAIINARGSTLERIADTVMLVGTGPEIAVISTKAFTAQLATLYQLAYACSDNYDIAQENIKNLGPTLTDWLTEDLQKQVLELAKELIDHEHIYIIGKHMNHPAAMEFALKIKETSYIHAESFAAGELKHGVIALIENETPCIVIGAQDGLEGELRSSAAELKARGGNIIGVAPFKGAEFDSHIETPHLGNEKGDLTIIANVIVGQLLGYYAAIGRGADPDKPRNLAKSVTVK